MPIKMEQAFMKNGEFQWVKLDKTIQVMEQAELIKDEAKLMKNLKKEMERDKSIIGIIETPNCRIKIHDNGKFSGVIWGGQFPKRLSGFWN